MDCRRCNGSGELSSKLGKPDPKRDTHAPYNGPWCVYPSRLCPVCYGTGVVRDRENRVANRRIRLNSDGNVIDNQPMEKP
jgi:hypothetical protein